MASVADSSKVGNVDTIAIDEAINLIKEKSWQDVSTARMLDGALLGLARSVDQYSDYLSPDNFKSFQSSVSGILYGIGIEFGRKDDVFVVFSVLPNSPAAKVGILPKDVMLSVDGVPCENMSAVAITNAIRGTEGVVEIGVGRRKPNGGNEILKFNPKRSKIVIEPVSSFTLGSAIFIKLSSFSKGARDSVLSHIKRLVRRHLRISGVEISGLIVDLRDNPGGLLEEAVDMASLFLSAGSPIVTVRTRDDEGIADFVAGEVKDPMVGKPIVVLVNEHTSSAAEILAVALQENNRAVVLGSTSYGKGSVQDIFPLISLPGAALKITFASYQTPLGYSMEGRGVRPDVSFVLNDVAYAVNSVVVRDEKIVKEALKVISSPGYYGRLMETANHPPANQRPKSRSANVLPDAFLQTSFLISRRDMVRAGSAKSSFGVFSLGDSQKTAMSIA